MKKVFLAVLAAVLLLWSIPASGEAVFAFEHFAYSLSVGSSLVLTPVFQGAEVPDKAVYAWESSDPKVLSVARGKITGKKAGTVTVTCRMQQGKETLYTTSCEVTVTQPIKKIKPEAKVIDIPFSAVKGIRYTYQLHPVLSPEGASGELVYKSLSPKILSVSEDGKVTTGTSDNVNVGYVLIEAADGSGASLKQKIRCCSFAVNIDKLELNERKVYRLRMPGDGAPLQLYHPTVRYDPMSLDITELYPADHVLYASRYDKETGEYWIDVRPVKPGKTTLKLYVDDLWFDSSPNYKITVSIPEEACYTQKNCPPLKYREASANAHAVEGQPVSVKGKFMRRLSEEGSVPVQFEVATKGKNEDTVIVEFPSHTGTKRIPDLLPGDSVEVYGSFLAPVEKKTETGLTLTTLRIGVNRFANIVYNTEVQDVSLYDWEGHE